MVSSIAAHSKVKNPRQNHPQFLKNSQLIPTQEKGLQKTGYLHSSKVNSYQLSRPSLLKENEQNKETKNLFEGNTDN